MQSVAAALNNLSLARSEEPRVTGRYKLAETVVAVRWAWLALPVLLEVPGAVVLVLVLLRKRRAAGVWKDSVLAVVYHGLDNKDGALHREDAKTLTEFQEAATATRVQLLRKPAGNSNGDKVVLAAA